MSNPSYPGFLGFLVFSHIFSNFEPVNFLFEIQAFFAVSFSAKFAKNGQSQVGNLPVAKFEFFIFEFLAILAFDSIGFVDSILSENMLKGNKLHGQVGDLPRLTEYRIFE